MTQNKIMFFGPFNSYFCIAWHIFETKNWHLSTKIFRMVHFQTSGMVKKWKHIGSLITKHVTPIQKSCALLCNNHTMYRSFNLYRRNYELNRDDVFSTLAGESILSDKNDCQHSGLKRKYVPVCQETRERVNIQDDSTETECQINFKRVDAVLVWKNLENENERILSQRNHVPYDLLTEINER